MALVDPKLVGKTQGPQVIILLAAVPKDQVIINEPDALHAGRKVCVEGEKLILFAQVYEDGNTVGLSSIDWLSLVGA